MRRMLAVFVTIWCAEAQQDIKVTYLATQASVQDIVIDLAKRVGLGYNWGKSFAQTDPECRRFVDHVSIENQPFDKAMARILDPVGLSYRVEDGQVVLYRR